MCAIELQQAHIIDDPGKLIAHLIMKIACNFLPQRLLFFYTDPFHHHKLVDAGLYTDIEYERHGAYKEYENACEKRGSLIERCLDIESIGYYRGRPASVIISCHD